MFRNNQEKTRHLSDYIRAVLKSVALIKKHFPKVITQLF